MNPNVSALPLAIRIELDAFMSGVQNWAVKKDIHDICTKT